MFRQFCNPCFERDKIIKSSAYKREFSLVPFGRIKGSDDAVLFSEKGSSFKYRLNRRGLSMQPCLTPLEYLNDFVLFWPSLIAQFDFEYKFVIKLYILPSMS